MAYTYNLPKEYGSVQGGSNWYYYYNGNSVTTPTQASWDNNLVPYGIQTYYFWKSPANRYLEITGRNDTDWKLPGGANGQFLNGENSDLSIGWKAPSAGTINITCMANTAYTDTTLHGTDDGTYLSIYKGAVRIAGESRVWHGDSEAARIASVTLSAKTSVNAGDMIYMYSRRGTWQDADQMYYSITISDDPTADFTPPVTSYTSSGNNLTLSAIDTGSGVAETEYYQYSPASGSWTQYTTPIALADGTYSFAIRSIDNTGNLEPYQRITVAFVNTPPIAKDDFYSDAQDTTLNIAVPGVLANDTDPDGNPLTAALVSVPSHGAVTLNTNGSFSYVPDTAFNGTDSFLYQANDGFASSANARVNVTVIPPPTAKDDFYTGSQDTTLNIAAPGVLANDTDPNGYALTASLVSVPLHGAVSLNAAGSFSYVPDTTFNGTDSFLYTANNGYATSANARVNVTVSPAPPAPAPPPSGGGIGVPIGYPNPSPAPTTVVPTITPTPTRTPRIGTVQNKETGKLFPSIQEAIDDEDTVNGHTIMVAPGTYPESVAVTKRLTIKSTEGPEFTIIQPPAGSSQAVRAEMKPNAALAQNMQQLIIQPGYGFSVKSGDTVIEGFTILGATREAILLEGVSAVGVRNNIITGNSVGISVISGGQSTVTFGDLSRGKTGDAVSSHIIENNTVSNNGIGIGLGGASSARIADNQIVDNAGEGIVLRSGSTQNTITGNNLMRNGIGISVNASATNTIYNNCFENIVDYLDDGSANTWNLAKTPGTNILSEHFIGGNYWQNYPGTDTDKDGLGNTDVPFGPGDMLPLLRVTRPVKNLDTGLTYPTIQQAIDAAETRDSHTILLENGTYTGNVQVTKAIRLFSYGLPNQTIIQPADPGAAVIEVSASSFTLDNVTVDGISPDSGDKAGILLNDGNTRVTNCIITASLQGIASGKESGIRNAKRVAVISQEEKTAEREKTGSPQLHLYNSEISYTKNGIHLSGSKDSRIENTVISSNEYGILLDSETTGTTITGSTLRDSESAGILISTGGGNTVFGSTIENSKVGIDLEDTQENTISGCRVTDNNLGIVVRQSARNTVYNNVWYNDENTQTDEQDSGKLNVWFVPSSPGPNIIGGQHLGGNRWSDYAGSDADGDGFGDEPYLIKGGGKEGGRENMDELPLVSLSVHNLNTNISYTKIQPAIDDPLTGPGHVIVADHGEYRENILVNKGITLRPSALSAPTIIHAQDTGTNAVTITAGNTTLSGFIITGATGENAAAVEIRNAQNSVIDSALIRKNAIGILLKQASNNTIKNSIVSDNTYGLFLTDSHDNTLYNNYFSNRNNSAGNLNPNTWNLPLFTALNIVNGTKTAGNFWSDYYGADTNNDGIGNTLLPYMPEGSTTGDHAPLVPWRAGTIHINGNANFTPANGVLHGSGTAADPYVIEGYTLDMNVINPSGLNELPPIWVENTDAYFVIRNCRFYSYNAPGIYIDNVKNGKIEGVRTILPSSPIGSKTSIFVNRSLDIDITGSTIETKKRDLSTAIKIASSSAVRITDNTITGSYSTSTATTSYATYTQTGIGLTKSSNCVINRNTVSSFEQTAISLDSSDGNTITENAISLCTIGIKVSSGNGNRISGNDISRYSIGKVFTMGSVTISEYNTVQFQSIGTGVLIFNSAFTTAENNHIRQGLCGVHLVSASNNTIKNNLIEQNRAVVPNYVIQYPVGGVQFDPLANNNILENNTITGNVQGIRLMMYSSGNMIRNNTVSSLPGATQDVGVHIEGSSANTLTGNMFYQNGIGLEKVLYATGDNLIYNNIFDNAVTVSQRYNATSYNYDDVFSVANLADYKSVCTAGSHDSYNISKTAGKNIIGGPYIGGNYWSNYYGADTNGDRLGDTNLPFGNAAGCSADYYPLINPKTTHITKNAEFTPENRVYRGSGTAADPYVLEDLDLETSNGHGIWIENTTAYFLIQNCTLHDGKARGLYGLFLQNVTNGRVSDLTVTNNNFGAFVLDSQSVALDRVHAVANAEGMRIEESFGIVITNSTVTRNTQGISVVNSSGVRIIEDSATDNDYGFVVSQTSQSSIEKSNASANKKTGITVSASNGIGINRTTASVHLAEGGLFVDSTTGMIIADNRFDLERKYGILVKNSAGITVRNNTVSNILGGLTDARGVSLVDTSSALVENNTITRCQPQVFDGQGIWMQGSDAIIRNNILTANTNGIALKGSGGEVTGNLITGNYNGIRILDNPGGSAKTLVIRQNTINNNIEAGIRFAATTLTYTITENQFYGNTYGIFYDSPVAGTVTRSALYLNGENDAKSDWWSWDGTTKPVYTLLYSGSEQPVNVTLTEMFQVTNPSRWPNASWGSPILRAAITNVSSGMNYTAYDVGGLIGVQVSGNARAGFASERLTIIDRQNKTNRHILQNATINGTAVSKSFVYDILTYDDGPYELQYDLTDKQGRTATGYAQFNIKNSRFVIKNITATKADRIYTFVRTKVNGVQVNGSNYFAKNERGSTVTVTIKNDGVKEGFGRIEIGVPDYLNSVVENQTKYISLTPGEERNYSFYLPLTKYTWTDGWKPEDPAVFPADKKIPISAEVRSVPSYAVCDAKPAVVPFMLGPIFNTTAPPSESLVYALGGVNPPYDGDGDSTVEAAESHHFNIEFRNIGDEAADITTVVYEDLIHTNTTKYLRNARDDGFITHAVTYTPYDTFPSPLIFYAPDNAANLGTNLFGKLYPKGTTSAEGQTFTGDQHPLVRKVIRNGYIGWWTDNPAMGIYPPADYAGRVEAIIMPKYTVVGETEPIVYYSPSLNRLPFSVRALNKSFVPAERLMKGGDIFLQTYAADPTTGTVQFVVKNSNEDVYFQYRADSHFDPNPDGYLWYHVIPPEYTANVFVDDARDPAYAIAHMRVDYAVKWSLWANELKLGSMALEAAVGIIVDEATGGTVDLKFADLIMSSTDTLLQVMNAVESINHGAQPIVKINGITFDQAKVADLASHGLNADYFNDIRNGDIDSNTVTTFFSAVNQDDDLREVFKREILKTLAKNFGLDELYNRMSDPEGAAADDFDELKDKLLEELQDQEVLSKQQGEQIGAVADAAKTFMDMGEWTYNNIAASGEEYTLIYVVDPPDTLTTTIEPVYAANVFGGSSGTATGNGSGHITVSLLPDGRVNARGEYEADASETGIDLSKMNEMNVTIVGARNERGMAGCVTMVIVPYPEYALDAAIAFKNPNLQKAMITSRFEKLETINAVTDGDRIVLSGTGLLLATREDKSVSSSIRIRDGKVHASLERVGTYGTTNWTGATIALSFAPVINVPLERTTLDLNVPAGATVIADLAFTKSGDGYHLDQAPPAMNVEIQYNLLPYGAGALVIIAACIGGVYLWRRKRK